jgi:threonine dehydrogenase-like Zn-dependent dehydrogenase
MRGAVHMDLAREFGATHFIDNSKESPVPKIKELTGGGGADVVFEVIGDPGQMGMRMGLGQGAHSS